MHTDWAVKRIKRGVRCCFSFYVDDCSRKLYALQAYPKASLENTIDNFKTAVQKVTNLIRIELPFVIKLN